MPRDMSNTYRWMTIDDLEELKRRKKGRLFTIRNKYMGYLDLQEVRNIEYNIKQIDAEIACKSAQLAMFE